MAVDIYVRVSRVGGREHLISPEEQERDARAFAEKRGLTIGQVFTDLDESGGTTNRPELQKALDRVRKGKSGGIVVAYLSRLTRDTSQGLELIAEIQGAGGEVYAPNLADHTTADGRMINTIQLAIDAGMRERAKEQIARSREAAIAKGVPVTNRAAVGYVREPRTRKYALDPEVAPVVRELFERRAAGAPYSELARLLESHGVKTSQGSSTWSREAVASLIKSRTYLGEIRSGPYVNKEAHRPIVDEVTWLAAQSPTPGPRRRKDSYLLSGILRCATCGYCMQGTRSSRGKRLYRCKKWHAGGECPEPARIDAEAVEEKVLAEIRGKLMTRKKDTKAVVDLAPFEDAFAAAERRLTQAETPEAMDALADRWASLVKERREERDEAGRALGDAQAKNPAIGAFWDQYEDFDDADATMEEKRAAILGVMPAIGVRRDKSLIFSPDTSKLTRRGYRREAKLNPLEPLKELR
jgi:DNA invertase Pin-like site-specific DNA recombinase/ribosomal protein L34E